MRVLIWPPEQVGARLLLIRQWLVVKLVSALIVKSFLNANHLLACLPICLPVCLPAYLASYLPVCLPVCLPNLALALKAQSARSDRNWFKCHLTGTESFAKEKLTGIPATGELERGRERRDNCLLCL